MRLLKCVQYGQLKEGEPVLALGMHITKWSADMGVPDYGFVSFFGEKKLTKLSIKNIDK